VENTNEKLFCGIIKNNSLTIWYIDDNM